MIPRSVYFVQAVEGGPIKIGSAIHPKSRLRELQMCCPIVLRVLGVIAGGEELERKLHKQFATLRLHGEWFEPRDELLSYIAANVAEMDSTGPMRRQKTGGIRTELNLSGETCKSIKELQESLSAEERRRVTASEVVRRAIYELAEELGIRIAR